MEKRVVITGIGTINPIGKNIDESWNGIINGICGIDNIKAFNTETFKTKLAAEVKDYDATLYFDPKQAKRMDKSSQYAIIASREAVKNSGITQENTDYKRVGIFISTGIGGLETIQNNCETNIIKGNNRVSPMFIPNGIANMPAGNVSIEFGFKGESMALVTACASSTHAIGEAYKTIKHGYEDVVLAGGSEASITTVGIAGFENMKALCSSEDKNRASIPFDNERAGFVMGEGAGVLVLEELEHAKLRNAKILAEVIGFGSSTDAYHITSPCPDGEGGAYAIERALNDAKLEPNKIDYINAHGTSTHLNDLTETLAIKKAFGDYSKELKVSSTKGNTGHLLGAAGAVEAIFCIKALENGIIPATINYKEKDPECDLDIVPNKNLNKEIHYAMSNSLGFGGHNSSIILKKWEE